MPGDARPAPDEEPEIADAQHLYDDAPASSVHATNAPLRADADGGYAMQESEEPEPAPRPAVVPPTPADRPNAPRPAERMTLEPSQAVEQLWSRWAEWGPTLAVLVGAGALLVLLLYFAASAEMYGPVVFLLVVGGFALAVLSYPILITLERPVRVTPEQAINDFYSALSHHMPHHRRMWLLLSRAGRTSGAFASFEGFQSYWRERLAHLRGDRIAKVVPLKFQVVGFKAAKSAGLSAIEASYTIEVYVRGRTSAGPIATYHIATSLAKGPDRMWYLDQGTLPEQPSR